MKRFWEQSPLWQSKQDFQAALDAATEAMDRAGRGVLVCVQLNAVSPDSDRWRERCRAYLDAVEVYEDAYTAWEAALDAFNASPAGQARDRYFKDPLVATTAESEAA